MDSKQAALPPAQYVDIFLPDGHHSGVRIDVARGIIEIKRRSVSYFYDLTQIATIPIANVEHTCYDR